MDWHIAFARQAHSDLAARDALLSIRSLPACHQLHYLQMACEKLAKAHLIAGGADPLALQRSHAYVAKQLPIIARHFLARQTQNRPKRTWIIAAISRLARQIELLAPAVDEAGRSPANCEYPWQLADGRIVAPADHTFELSLLYAKAGTTLLKIMRLAIGELLALAQADGRRR